MTYPRPDAELLTAFWGALKWYTKIWLFIRFPRETSEAWAEYHELNS